MERVDFSIHGVSRISVSTAKKGPHEDEYVLHQVVIHYTDRLGHPTALSLNLFGEHGLAEVPFMFGGCVVAAKAKEEVL